MVQGDRWLVAATTKNRPVLSAPGDMAHRGATETASGVAASASLSSGKIVYSATGQDVVIWKQERGSRGKMGYSSS